MFRIEHNSPKVKSFYFFVRLGLNSLSSIVHFTQFQLRTFYIERECPKRRDFVCVSPAGGGGDTARYLYFDTPLWNLHIDILQIIG